jgi:hypothetical protein
MEIATDVVAQAANLEYTVAFGLFGEYMPPLEGDWEWLNLANSRVEARRSEMASRTGLESVMMLLWMARGLSDGLVHNVDRYTDDWPSRALTSDAASFR